MLLRSPAAAAWLSAGTIFTSAFLLFQVQPLISKVILPWFGGSPAVWSTCVLFFQIALLAGYAYAHALVRSQSRWKWVVHAVLLVVAILTLPITPAESWKPADGQLPTSRILMLLLFNVGLPYFLLASTGPLVQAWFGRLIPGTSPYRLYALSNVGSLAALLTYPVVFEPNFSTTVQGWGWSLGFACFALMAGTLGWLVANHEGAVSGNGPPTASSDPVEAEGSSPEDAPLTWWQPILWVLLAALGTTALLAVTNHLCQDIAVTPFFWVVPLSLYLLSFIIVFDNSWWYRPILTALATLGSAALIVACERSDLIDEYFVDFGRKVVKTEWERPAGAFLEWAFSWLDSGFSTYTLEDSVAVYSTIYLLWFFALCLLCHGEVAALKPGRKYLTAFYLMISAGGAIGGIFVSLLCPRYFVTYFELPLSLLMGTIVAGIALVARTMIFSHRRWPIGPMKYVLPSAALIVGLVMLSFISPNIWPTNSPDVIFRARNFYGRVSVSMKDSDDPENEGLALYHGRILHGFQYTNRPEEPCSYYAHGSGVAIAVEQFPRERLTQFRIAVVGLGSGSMAAHAQRGDLIRFYEIDPQVVDLSGQYFTYRQDAIDRGATVEVVLGDARVSLEREDTQDFDVIVLDAFSGDAIPVHLLTQEAVATYLRHLRPGGIIAVHISNRYLNLKPVVRGLARHFRLEPRLVDFTSTDYGEGGADSEWILLTNNQRFLQNPVVEQQSTLEDGQDDSVADVFWTDQRSDLFRIMD